MTRFALWSVVLASLVLIAPRRGSACICGEFGALLAFPSPMRTAPPSSHLWLWVHQSLLADVFCADPAGSDTISKNPALCKRMPHLVLRRAYATGEEEPAVLATHTKVVRAGIRSMIEVIPEQSLSPGARYELWWDEPDGKIPPRVISTFRVQGAPDRTAPVWVSAPRATWFAYRPPPPHSKIVDFCGQPLRSVSFDQARVTDADTEAAPLYAAWFSSNSSVDDTRDPDVILPGPRVLSQLTTPPAEDKNVNKNEDERLFLGQQTDPLSSEGCIEHNAIIPAGRGAVVALKALDLSGNFSTLVKFANP